VDAPFIAKQSADPHALQAKIESLSVQLQSAATAEQPRGLGKMTSVVIESGDRQLASL